MPSGGDASTAGRRQALRRVDLAVEAVCRVAHSSMLSSSRPILRSASAHMLRSEPENCALPSLMPASRPTSLTPICGQRVEVERRALGRADELQRRHPRARDDVVDFIVALVEHAGGIHPPLDVLAAIDARRANVLADRQRHRPAGALDLVGELHAGRRRADDQNAAVLELAGIAILPARSACAIDDGHALRKPARWRCCRRRSRARRVRQRQSP